MTPAGQKADGLPADPEFLDAAFKAEEGEDNDPFPAKSGVNYAVKVEGVTPPKLKPLDQVRADAIAAWTEEQKGTALAKKAALLAAQAQADKNLTNIARTLKVPLQQSQALTRQTNDTTFSGPLVEKIFTAAPGGIVMGQQGVGANFIIAQVSGISHAAPAPRDNTFQAGIAQMSQQAANDITVSFANGARLKQGVSVNQKLVQSAMGSGQ
jgi:peptidyl-prolyl cis-trans isomerase D